MGWGRLHCLIFNEDSLYMRELVRKFAVVGLPMMIASNVDDCDLYGVIRSSLIATSTSAGERHILRP